ncbi:MAG: pseudouridine synthase, partial [Planctomycetota bacterium]|nr:pseudouridine synthase [Planctomycetota bacterium]
MRDAKRGPGFVRLNKFLADNGVASRRASDEMILGGKVLVDGEIITQLGTKIDPSEQVVEVDGVRLESDPRERRYYILHKPAGVVCTNEVRETRPRAIDLVTDPRKGRIFTVGRLDEESKGLLLLTSDGEFAERIAHPRYGVPKTYLVKVPGRITDDAVMKVREGVHLAEGKTSGARVLIKRRTATSSTLEVTIQEGKNREVRRVFARVGYKVQSLTRTRIGPLGIRGLREGKWRALSREEVEALVTESGPNA